MAITSRDVAKVSLLARLQLSQAELDRLTVELAQIVDYVDHLSEVSTEGVDPMLHAVETHNVFVGDNVLPSLPRHKVLANAPRHNDRAFLVPPVLG